MEDLVEGSAGRDEGQVGNRGDKYREEYHRVPASFAHGTGLPRALVRHVRCLSYPQATLARMARCTSSSSRPQ